MARKLSAAKAEIIDFVSGPALMLKNHDPVVIFDDGTEEVVKVQGIGPVGAIYTAAMSARGWPAEKQLRVIAIRMPNATI